MRRTSQRARQNWSRWTVTVHGPAVESGWRQTALTSDMRKMKALEACTNAELIAIILRLKEQVDGLEQHVCDLEAQIAKLRKDSSTSSKPPSSDIVKPPKSIPKGKHKEQRRKIGGQVGHSKHVTVHGSASNSEGIG